MSINVNGLNRDAELLTIGVSPNNNNNKINQNEFKKEFENKINEKNKEIDKKENIKEKNIEPKEKKEINKKEKDNENNKKEIRKKENNHTRENKETNKEKNIKHINKNTIDSEIEKIIEKFTENTKKINQSKINLKQNFSKNKEIKTETNVKDIFLKQTETKNELSNKKNINKKKQEIDEKLIETKSKNENKSINTNKELQVETKTIKPQKTNHNIKENKIEITINDLTNNKEVNLDLKEFKVHKISNMQEIIENYSVIKDKIVNSLENSIKFLINNNENKVSIKLHPPELGKIHIELVVKDNNVEAKINTENHHVREVILSNLEQLKSNLNNSGFQISKFNVEVGGFKNFFEQNFNNAEGNGKKHKNIFGKYNNYALNTELLNDEIQLNSIPNFFSGKVINIVI